MGCSCKIFTTAILLLVFGIAIPVVTGVFWVTLANLSGLNFNSVATIYISGWTLSGVVIASPVAILCGIIGLIGSCQQGQCITLTYMVCSVLTSFTYICMLIGSSVLLASHCADGFDKCMQEDKERELSVILIVIVSLSFLITAVSLLASCISCRARCYCCGAEPKRSHDVAVQDNIAMSTVPQMQAPETFYVTERQSPTAPPMYP